jgi:hypothetical protein
MKKSRDTITQSKITFGCFGMLVGMIILYLYFLNMSVVQVVMRTEHVDQQRTIQAEIALLEAQYIKAQHTIASRVATLEGYDTNTNKIFITRGETNLVLRDR